MYRPKSRSARAEVAWAIAAFAVIELVLALCIERWLPEARDAEYVAKRELLREFIAQSPGRPLTVVLGTSRTQMALDAEFLNQGGNRCQTFNMGFEGTSTMMHRVHLRRLREDRIRPDLLVLEVVPAQLFVGDGRPGEDVWFNGAQYRADEVSLIYPYHTRPPRLVRRWVWGRILPCVIHQDGLRRFLALHRAPDGKPVDDVAEGLDHCGWKPHPGGLSPEKLEDRCRKSLDDYRNQFRNPLLSTAKCQALRDILDDCRREEIPTALILMPEASAFRALYPEGTDQKLFEFLSELKDTYGLLQVIDARGWVDDSGFVDAHHVHKDGARSFTKRFGAEAIAPLFSRLARKPDAIGLSVNRNGSVR